MSARIETAPRDGTNVYLVIPSLDFAPIARWGFLEYADGCSARMVWVLADPEIEIGQCNGAIGWEEDNSDILPTHWFPVPACAEHQPAQTAQINQGRASGENED